MKTMFVLVALILSPGKRESKCFTYQTDEQCKIALTFNDFLTEDHKLDSKVFKKCIEVQYEEFDNFNCSNFKF